MLRCDIIHVRSGWFGTGCFGRGIKMRFVDCVEIMRMIVFAACGMCVCAAFAGATVELKNAGFHQTDGKGGAVGWSHHPNWHAEKAGHNGSGAIVWECASESEVKIGGPGQEVKLKPGETRIEKLTMPQVTEQETVETNFEVAGTDGKDVFYRRAFRWSPAKPKIFAAASAGPSDLVSLKFAYYPSTEQMFLRMDAGGLKNPAELEPTLCRKTLC